MTESETLRWDLWSNDPTVWQLRLTCIHGETEGGYSAGDVPKGNFPVRYVEAARTMLRTHRETYGCECGQQWWDSYMPVGET